MKDLHSKYSVPGFTPNTQKVTKVKPTAKKKRLKMRDWSLLQFTDNGLANKFREMFKED